MPLPPEISRDKRHRVVQPAAFLANLEHLNDIRMAHGVGGADLSAKALHEFGRTAGFRFHRLDRHHLAGRSATGLIDDAHAALTGQVEQLVLAEGR